MSLCQTAKLYAVCHKVPSVAPHTTLIFCIHGWCIVSIGQGPIVPQAWLSCPDAACGPLHPCAIA